MKKLMIAVLCLLTLVACKQNSNNAAELALQQQRDSLTRIIEQKDNEIDDMMATMNDIQEGFRAINEAEQRVTIASNGEGVSEAESIRENMQFIQQTVCRHNGGSRSNDRREKHERGIQSGDVRIQRQHPASVSSCPRAIP